MRSPPGTEDEVCALHLALVRLASYIVATYPEGKMLLVGDSDDDDDQEYANAVDGGGEKKFKDGTDPSWRPETFASICVLLLATQLHHIDPVSTPHNHPRYVWHSALASMSRLNRLTK